MKKKSEKLVKVFTWILFTMYIMIVFYFTFFSEHFGRTKIHNDYSYNLIPFKEIKRFWKYRGLLGFENVMVNLFGNVLVFVPFGIILPFLSRRSRSFLLVTLLTLEFSLLIEVIQLITRKGCFDVDDLILNTLGGSLGYILLLGMVMIKRKWRKRNA
ncbi:MAG: VanZ family protein [Lachnospiraceae bacterium]|nr:VanZ family protein [Lachnospiraceae bacterium]